MLGAAAELNGANSESERGANPMLWVCVCVVCLADWPLPSLPLVSGINFIPTLFIPLTREVVPQPKWNSTGSE